MKPARLALTNRLVQGYGLHKYMDVYSPRWATREELETFHDSDYVDFLSTYVCHTHQCQTVDAPLGGVYPVQLRRRLPGV